jgi:hypothetical protein
MPTPKQMAKLAAEAARRPSPSTAAPEAPLSAEYWESVLKGPRAGTTGAQMRQRRLSEIQRQVLRVSCRRCGGPWKSRPPMRSAVCCDFKCPSRRSRKQDHLRRRVDHPRFARCAGDAGSFHACVGRDEAHRLEAPEQVGNAALRRQADGGLRARQPALEDRGVARLVRIVGHQRDGIADANVGGRMPRCMPTHTREFALFGRVSFTCMDRMDLVLNKGKREDVAAALLGHPPIRKHPLRRAYAHTGMI